MVLLGSFVNGIAVVLAGIVGAFIGKRLPKRICDTVMHGMALCIIFIGVDGALSGDDTLVMIISIAIGAVLGEIINLDKWLNRFGDFLQSPVVFKEGKISVDVCLTYIVGRKVRYDSAYSQGRIRM